MYSSEIYALFFEVEKIEGNQSTNTKRDNVMYCHVFPTYLTKSIEFNLISGMKN